MQLCRGHQHEHHEALPAIALTSALAARCVRACRQEVPYTHRTHAIMMVTTTMEKHIGQQTFQEVRASSSITKLGDAARMRRTAVHTTAVCAPCVQHTPSVAALAAALHMRPSRRSRSRRPQSTSCCRPTTQRCTS